MTPQDIVDFGLEDATHPLAATDIKRAQDALQNDPFIMAHPEWIAAMKQMLHMGVRAKQQALAKWGLNYVINDYLPEARQRGRFLAVELHINAVSFVYRIGREPLELPTA